MESTPSLPNAAPTATRALAVDEDKGPEVPTLTISSTSLTVNAGGSVVGGPSFPHGMRPEAPGSLQQPGSFRAIVGVGHLCNCNVSFICTSKATIRSYGLS